MKKSKRLLPVQKISKMREDDAARSVGLVRQEIRKEENQLEELVNYREEYQSSIAVGSSPSGKQLQDFHGFLANLNVAITQQEHRLVDVRHRLETKITDWEQAHGKLKAMGKLINKFEQEEAVLETKNEQRIIDDLPKNLNKGSNQMLF